MISFSRVYALFTALSSCPLIYAGTFCRESFIDGHVRLLCRYLHRALDAIGHLAHDFFCDRNRLTHFITNGPSSNETARAQSAILMRQGDDIFIPATAMLNF